MANDNTLGAPTEGLGQTVTFTGNGSGRAPQAQAKQRQAVRNNSTGGGAQITARALQIPQAVGDTTFTVLAKLAGDVLKPQIEAERTAAYVQGMQKAATGQAIKEIVDEQPWYSKLFGSTSLVDGARAYTASAKANSVAVEMESDMESLRKLSPTEFTAHAVGKLQAANTGDSVTDMMITQQISSTLPAVMKGQAKAHLRFQQEQFENGIMSAAEAKFALLGTVSAQSRTIGATKEEGDVLGTAISTLDMFNNPGMDQATHDKLIGAAAIKSISGGNFDTYTLLQNTGKLASLDPQVSYHVQRSYEQASNRAKLNVPIEYLDKVAEFQAMARKPGTTSEKIIEEVTTLNAEYTKLSGDPSKFVNAATTVGELRQMREYQDMRLAQLATKRDATQTKANKEAAELQLVSETATRVITGDSQNPYLMLSQTPKEAQAVFDHIRATAPQATLMKALVGQVDVAIDKVFKDQTVAAIGTAKRAGDPAMLYQVYVQRYLPLLQAGGDDGPAVAEQYSGQYGKDMAAYHALAQGQQLDAITQGVFYNEVVAPQPKPLTKSDRNSAIVNEVTTGRIMSMFTTPIKDPAGYAALLAPRTKDYLDPASAVKDAKINSPDISLIGGYHWKLGAASSSLTQWVAKNKVMGGVAPDTLDKAFEITVQQEAATAGIVSGIKVGQTTDSANGEPTMYVMGVGSDDKPKIRIFGAARLHEVWKSGEDRLTRDDLVFGPAPRPLVDEDMPSIYTGTDAEWKAFRERQAARATTTRK